MRADLIAGVLPGLSAVTPVDRQREPSGRQQFADVLKTASTVKFSDHAQGRMHRYGMKMSSQDLGRLEDALGRVASKGSRQSLVVMDDRAFVCSVPNKTVITAIDRANMKDAVFTNIDSAIIA